MDTLGAVIGPSFALLYLYFYPENYKTLFFVAFIPGLLAVIASLFLKEKKVIIEMSIMGLVFLMRQSLQETFYHHLK